MASELNKLTLAEASAMLRKREISALELTRDCLQRIAAVEPKLNAFITVCEKEATEQARRADARLAAGGDEAPALERLAAELGLAGRVRFLGPRPRDQVLELFRAADAALLSSSWENFPHAVVEALAVGTPVVATATGGVAEIVRDGQNGLLVQPGDAGALAAAIRRYFADEALRGRLRAAAAQSVSEYAPERVYAQLEAVLEQAAA